MAKRYREYGHRKGGLAILGVNNAGEMGDEREYLRWLMGQGLGPVLTPDGRTAEAREEDEWLDFDN